MSTRRTIHKMLTAGPITVPTASVKKLTDGTGAALSLAPGVGRLTIQNIGANNIEIGWSSGSAPTTGNMGIIAPLDSMTFESYELDLTNIYAKAATADTKAYVWQEGP